MSRDIYTHTERDAARYAEYDAVPDCDDRPDARELAEDFAPRPVRSFDGIFTPTINDDPWTLPGTWEVPF